MIPRCGYCHERLSTSDRGSFHEDGEATCGRCGAVLRVNHSDANLAGLIGMGVMIAGFATIVIWPPLVVVPLTVVAGCAAIYFLWQRVRMTVVQPGAGYCPVCGHNLKGAARGGGFTTCPECGTTTGKPAHD